MKKMISMLPKKQKKGFTLVEIMGVVALIAILFAIFVPKIGFSSNKVKTVGVQTDFRSYQLAMQCAANENGSYANIEASAGASATAEEKAQAVAKALNSYLDPALQVTAAADGTYSVAALDPWGHAYTVAKAGEVVTITSAGMDGVLADDAATTGVDEAADNYTVSCDGAAAGKITTTGFSNNIK